MSTDSDQVIAAIVRAWTNPGPRPDVHRAWQAKLRREWPSLATAVEQLVEAQRRAGRP